MMRAPTIKIVGLSGHDGMPQQIKRGGFHFSGRPDGGNTGGGWYNSYTADSDF